MEKANIVIKKAVEKNLLDREHWLAQAEICEKENFIGVTSSIIKFSIGLDVDEQDMYETFIEDAESCVKRGSIRTARAIYEHVLELFPDEKSTWVDLAFFEKSHGAEEYLFPVLERAISVAPETEVLWLMLAKEKWIKGDITGAKTVLSKAFISIPYSEEIWLAAIKLEIETKQLNTASDLLKEARVKADTARVWMKSAVLERLQGNIKNALNLVNNGIEKYPDFPKLWMIKGQILLDDMNDVEKARENYALAVKRLPKIDILWILASEVEEKAHSAIKARALLEKARILNPKIDSLWTAAVQIERRNGNIAMAKAMISKGLQECPNSGSLWSEQIILETRAQRKARSSDALKKCEDNSLLVCTIARLFWAERKIETSRKWFTRAIRTDPDIGDTWAWSLKFELVNGTLEQQNDIRRECIAAAPRHGKEWQKESKRLENNGKRIEEILEIVAAKLKNDLSK